MFKDILVPVDLNSEHSWQTALPIAVHMCQSMGARLHVMTVMPDFGLSMVGQYFPEGYEDKVLEAANTNLHALAKEQVPEGIEVQHIIADGTIYHEIVRVSKEIDADLIIMHSHHPVLSDYLLGPNAEKVTRHADCSVMIVRDDLD